MAATPLTWPLKISQQNRRSNEHFCGVSHGENHQKNDLTIRAGIFNMF
jgi:hypothetical protein